MVSFVSGSATGNGGNGVLASSTGTIMADNAESKNNTLCDFEAKLLSYIYATGTTSTTNTSTDYCTSDNGMIYQ